MLVPTRVHLSFDGTGKWVSSSDHPSHARRRGWVTGLRPRNTSGSGVCHVHIKAFKTSASFSGSGVFFSSFYLISNTDRILKGGRARKWKVPWTLNNHWVESHQGHRLYTVLWEGWTLAVADTETTVTRTMVLPTPRPPAPGPGRPAHTHSSPPAKLSVVFSPAWILLTMWLSVTIIWNLSMVFVITHLANNHAFDMNYNFNWLFMYFWFISLNNQACVQCIFHVFPKAGKTFSFSIEKKKKKIISKLNSKTKENMGDFGILMLLEQLYRSYVLGKGTKPVWVCVLTTKDCI